MASSSTAVRHDADLPSVSGCHVLLPRRAGLPSRAGDVLRVGPRDGRRAYALSGEVDSRQNSILLTERCDHYCLMCSQPPKTPGNDDWLLEDARELIRMLPPSTQEIGVHRRRADHVRRPVSSTCCGSRATYCRKRMSTISRTGAALWISALLPATRRSTTRT